MASSAPAIFCLIGCSSDHGLGCCLAQQRGYGEVPRRSLHCPVRTWQSGCAQTSEIKLKCCAEPCCRYLLDMMPDDGLSSPPAAAGPTHSPSLPHRLHTCMRFQTCHLLEACLSQSQTDWGAFMMHLLESMLMNM